MSDFLFFFAVLYLYTDRPIAVKKILSSEVQVSESLHGGIHTAFHQHCKNIRISMDILWRVFDILTELVPYAFVSVNRRNNEAP